LAGLNKNNLNFPRPASGIPSGCWIETKQIPVVSVAGATSTTGYVLASLRLALLNAWMNHLFLMFHVVYVTVFVT